MPIPSISSFSNNILDSFMNILMSTICVILPCCLQQKMQLSMLSLSFAYESYTIIMLNTAMRIDLVYLTVINHHRDFWPTGDSNHHLPFTISVYCHFATMGLAKKLRYKRVKDSNYLVNLLPHMPILGSSNSAANKNMTPKIWTNVDTII